MEIVSAIFGWLNDQLLKMAWLSDLVRMLVEKSLACLYPNAWRQPALFLYDTIKIFILLSS